MNDNEEFFYLFIFFVSEVLIQSLRRSFYHCIYISSLESEKIQCIISIACCIEDRLQVIIFKKFPITSRKFIFWSGTHNLL